ncbi:glycosyltransferase family 2 protein [Aquimarina sp. SS2-1]|uniref:glycosyltransferase family 2 protein n=1 Tax=Aquimarina besae TaxID=3342247 RepID=UPI003671EF4F
MLSILIPVYNYDVTPLVQELFHQLKTLDCTYEIIILDDCSTRPDLINLHGMELIPNCSYIIQSNNLGRTATRLNLAKMARYNWLLFLDADVMPKRKDFIRNLLKNINTNVDIIFGGVDYQSDEPNADIKLRWLYGRKKEINSVDKRNKNIYTSIISQNFLIQRNMCLEVLKEIDLNRYGLDIYFSYLLEQKEAKVLHIDNPTIHLGLEKNSSFLTKSMLSIETTLFLQKESKIPKNYRPIQRAYKLLKKTYTSGLFFLLIYKFENRIVTNIKSDKPSIFLFDLYRLYYFIKIQK